MRIIFIVLVAVIFGACDRDGPVPSDEGKIIGKWRDGSESTRNVDGSFNGTIRPCRVIPIAVFRADNSLHYQRPLDFSNRYLCSSVIHEGSWERLGNEKYRLIIKSIEGKAVDSIIEPIRIYFRDDPQVMIVQFEPVIDNGIDKPFYYETLFFKEEESLD